MAAQISMKGPSTGTSPGAAGMSARATKLKAAFQGEGLPAVWQCAVFLIFAVAVFSRRPDALLNPQFYAEDGAVWYANAYNSGPLISLLAPEGGYLNTFQRLVAALVLPFPFHVAPLLMNLVGIAVQVLPASILLSARCAAWGSLPARLLQAAAYIALPNVNELSITITNAPFHLALLAYLLATARPPANARWRAFDLIVLVVSGLSGPFCFVLLPVTLFFWWKRRHRWYLIVAAIAAIASAIQFTELWRAAASERPQRVLGANPKVFLQILVGQVYLAVVLGRHGAPSRTHLPGLVIAGILGTAILVYCLWKAQWQLRLFIVFSFALFAAALERPLTAGNIPAWEAIAPVSGMRYWFFPMLAFVWSLIWCATKKPIKGAYASGSVSLARVLAVCVLVLSLKGVANDWRHPEFKDMHFQEHAKKFEAAPAGTVVTIPIPPDWEFRLVKKG